MIVQKADSSVRNQDGRIWIPKLVLYRVILKYIYIYIYIKVLNSDELLLNFTLFAFTLPVEVLIIVMEFD